MAAGNLQHFPGFFNNPNGTTKSEFTVLARIGLVNVSGGQSATPSLPANRNPQIAENGFPAAVELGGDRSYTMSKLQRDTPINTETRHVVGRPGPTVVPIPAPARLPPYLGTGTYRQQELHLLCAEEAYEWLTKAKNTIVKMAEIPTNAAGRGLLLQMARDIPDFSGHVEVARCYFGSRDGAIFSNNTRQQTIKRLCFAGEYLG
ncbi:hypothetical protein B0T14DRAFT_559181 [Immersiella caudata]|uniref:Uncharacterized protein n=1 Tax=Immersiella caudata TaxID=314043 RepID=A0AA40CBL3_9PEZI|nr:hypothetical protein B0T14DRAFT_559181 [Immersiella caudata]